MRLIDKDELARKLNTGMNIIEVAQTIMDMPTIEERKTGKWIPVSELPKFVKTVDEGLEEENQVSDIVLVTNGKEVGPSELVKYWDEDEPFWVDPWAYDWPIDVHMDANEIIAWMPLPEPFKGGDPE